LRLLAIETSGRRGGAAAWQHGAVVAHQVLPGVRFHASQLLPAVEAVCRQAGWTPAQVSVVAVSVGPGSFTGLRVGVTFAKTLAMATGAKIVIVPSADVLAENAPSTIENVAVVLDAKRGEVFASLHRRVAGSLQRVKPAWICTPAQLLAEAPRPLLVLGEGIKIHATALSADGVTLADESLWHADAQVTARLGQALAARNEFVEPDTLVPTYLRRPEAEEVWEQRYG